MSALARIRENAEVSGPRVISAGHSAAAAAGAAAFAQGGNAFDAALAACFMEHIALPMKCGLAGDLIALFRRGGGPFQALISIGAGAQALADGGRIERTGPRSVGVPGAPQGYSMLLQFARRDIESLVAPAVHAANAGIPWSRVARSYVLEGADLLARYSPQNAYAPCGLIPQIGETRRLPGLGALLQAFVREREALFEGSAGARFIAAIAERGGIITQNDFAQRPARLLDPVREMVAPHRALTVTPAPTHGEQLLAIVRQASTTDAPLVEVVRAARAEAKRRGRQPADDGTSVVMSADDEGNAVVILHSNSFPQFASGIVLPDGLILNNRPGRGFDLEAPAGAANAPAAGKVPWTTLHAWLLERDGDEILGATPGGVNQLPWNAQSVTELLRGCDVGEAVTAPRWSLDAQDILAAEPGAETGLATGQPLPELSLRSAQQAIALSTTGLHRIAADPRTGATALAVY